jgi:hypothetical protein
VGSLPKIIVTILRKLSKSLALAILSAIMTGAFIKHRTNKIFLTHIEKLVGFTFKSILDMYLIRHLAKANPVYLQSSVYYYTSILEIKGKGSVRRRWHLQLQLLHLLLEFHKVPIEKVHL